MPETEQDITDAPNVAQWEPTGQYCDELQHECDCNRGIVCWGTSDE